MRFHPAIYLGLGFLGLSAPFDSLAAQQAACPVSPSLAGTTFGADASALPVDRIADLLALAPGVASLNHGELSIRGGARGGIGTYLNGVPVIPGRRDSASPLLGGSYLGDPGVGLAVGTNAFTALRLTPSLVSPEIGNATAGVVEVETTPCAPGSGDRRVSLRAAVASDAVLGAGHGLGFNRLTLNGDGTFGRLVAGFAATVEGQRTARLGLQQNDPPVYLADGVDTTVSYNDGGSDRTVDIVRFRAAPGIRLPSSAASSYAVAGHLGYYLGTRHRLQLTALGSQRQNRIFDYQALYNPRQALADRVWSQVVTGSWFGRLSDSGPVRLSAEGHLSLQWDHETGGPLTGDGERDSRDPATGIMLAPLDFRFDQSNFAVDEALIGNFRRNDGRRSPYDLDHSNQYQPVDEFRNDAYGILGWSESGGPVGRLTLYREKRLVGKGVVTADVGDRHRLRAGFEATRYDVDFYSSQLTSQAGADAYRESPALLALFGEYQLRYRELTLTGGARFDRFNSGASRPGFPRISSMPGFDPANPTAGFVADRSHSRVSPRLSAAFQVSPRARVFGGYTAFAQAPDFATLFQGINTDFSVTTQAQRYGTDLDFEHAEIIEAGAQFAPDEVTSLAGNLWSRGDRGVVINTLSSEFDPFTASQVDLNRYRNRGRARSTGVDVRITRSLGARGQAWVSYSFVSPDSLVKAASRDHNVAAAMLYQTGESRALGGALRRLGIYGAVRVATGTRYTRCLGSLAEESDVLSDNIFCHFYQDTLNSTRLPALKLVDLRVTRSVDLGSTSLVLFADARNLLNSRNVLRVFTQTGTTRNPLDIAQVRDGTINGFANEGDANGARRGDGALDLSFGNAADPRAACGGWTTASGTPAPPNCVYLINAEERFGDGDHIFTVAEQGRAAEALYYVARGEQNFTGPGRRVRLGVELRF
jgi:hypothetical protein